MTGHVMNIRRRIMIVSDRNCKKISMNNGVPMHLMVAVFMCKERMKMQRGKEKRDPQQDY